VEGFASMEIDYTIFPKVLANDAFARLSMFADYFKIDIANIFNMVASIPFFANSDYLDEILELLLGSMVPNHA
jgi:hypothetical protein